MTAEDATHAGLPKPGERFSEVLKQMTAASARQKVTVSVLKASLDRHFQISMAASVSSFRTNPNPNPSL